MSCSELRAPQSTCFLLVGASSFSRGYSCPLKPQKGCSFRSVPPLSLSLCYIGGSHRLLLGLPASRSGYSRLSVCKAFATQKPTNTKSGLCSKNIGRQLSVPHPSLASTFAPLAERLASFVLSFHVIEKLFSSYLN